MSATATTPSYFMTIDEAAAFLRYTETAKFPAPATRQWLKKHGVPTHRRGKHLLVSRKEVMDALATESAQQRRAS
jgi:hypothetical protein